MSNLLSVFSKNGYGHEPYCSEIDLISGFMFFNTPDATMTEQVTLLLLLLLLIIYNVIICIFRC